MWRAVLVWVWLVEQPMLNCTSSWMCWERITSSWSRSNENSYSMSTRSSPRMSSSSTMQRLRSREWVTSSTNSHKMLKPTRRRWSPISNKNYHKKGSREKKSDRNSIMKRVTWKLRSPRCRRRLINSNKTIWCFNLPSLMPCKNKLTYLNSLSKLSNNLGKHSSNFLIKREETPALFLNKSNLNLLRDNPCMEDLTENSLYLNQLQSRLYLKDRDMKIISQWLMVRFKV